MAIEVHSLTCGPWFFTDRGETWPIQGEDNSSFAEEGSNFLRPEGGRGQLNEDHCFT